MPDGCFACIVQGLWLRHIHNATRDTSDKHHGPGYLAFYHVLCDSCREVVGAFDVYAQHSFDPFWRESDGVSILTEASTSYQICNLGVLSKDFGNGRVDFGFRGDISIVSCYFGSPFQIVVRIRDIGGSRRLTFDWGMSLKMT